MIETKICLECGRKYRPDIKCINRQKYCSKKCSDKFWRLSIKERKKLKDIIKKRKLFFRTTIKRLEEIHRFYLKHLDSIGLAALLDEIKNLQKDLKKLYYK